VPNGNEHVRPLCLIRRAVHSNTHTISRTGSPDVGGSAPFQRDEAAALLKEIRELLSEMNRRQAISGGTRTLVVSCFGTLLIKG
jgi:hypothetical protein